MQLALKLLANATSYGVLVEVVVDEKKASVPCDVYHGGDKTRLRARKKSISLDGELNDGFKVERPGKYFAPYGGLIPAAGRLFLAIAETLAQREGLLCGFCDTDSMFFGRPPGMERGAFRAAVQRIAGPAGWFQPLSPYSDGGTLFALEDVNYRLCDDTSGKIVEDFETLYCLAISAKRYALFNIIDNQTVMRKISAHGLGGLRHIDTYDPSAHKLTKLEHVAAPVNKDNDDEARRLEKAFKHGEAGVTADDVKAAKLKIRSYGEIAHGPVPRLLCDIWRVAVDCFRTGKQTQIDAIIGKLPQLQIPQYSQIAMSSTHLLKLYPNLPNMRGFQFFSVFPAPRCAINALADISKYVDAP